jgi:hypothetical protein
MENKKGEMTIGVLVTIILGLIVLVVIALGFSMGWSELWEKVNVFSGGGSLSSAGQACQVACASGDLNAYCKQGHTIKDPFTQAEYDNLVKRNTKIEGTAKDSNDLSKGYTKIIGVTCRDLQLEEHIVVEDTCTKLACP